MALVPIFSKIKLLFGLLVIQLVWYKLKQLFSSVSVIIITIMIMIMIMILIILIMIMQNLYSAISAISVSSMSV